ncbi:MAG: hypothetical protein KAI79_00685 [Bacteroidales bacterium]|nr:hypothetical protein [Bacteroidales bacterium]
MKIIITDINHNDYYYQFKDELIGKEFESDITFSNVMLEGWKTAVGNFTNQIFDSKVNGGKPSEAPITLTTIKYDVK